MKSAFIFLCVGQSLLLWSDIASGKYTAESADYVVESKFECRYMNGTETVRFLHRVFYNQEEIVYFDSEVGRYVPKTELGRPDAEYWNKNKEIIADRQASVQTYCIPNYEVSETAGITGRRVEPKAKISLMPQDEETHVDYHMLMCNVYDFYPSEIEVKWYRNGQEETSQVQATELYQNGDWTFQIMVMLETEIKKGDTFSCEVHHTSLKTPIKIDWHPQMSDSSTSKVVTGIVGFVLGIVFVIAGVVVCLRGRKAQMLSRGPQAEHLYVHS